MKMRKEVYMFSFFRISASGEVLSSRAVELDCRQIKSIKSNEDYIILTSNESDLHRIFSMENFESVTQDLTVPTSSKIVCSNDRTVEVSQEDNLLSFRTLG